MVQLVRHAAFTSHTTTRRPACLYVSCRPVRRIPAELARRQEGQRCRATVPDQPASGQAPLGDAEFVGIPPEEDVEVPGTYLDALNPNTKLGKAVRSAVDELNHLNSMEMDTLQQCDSLLKQLGLKTSIMQPPADAPQPPPAEQ